MFRFSIRQILLTTALVAMFLAWHSSIVNRPVEYTHVESFVSDFSSTTTQRASDPELIDDLLKSQCWFLRMFDL